MTQNIINFNGLETRKGAAPTASSQSVQFISRGIEMRCLTDCMCYNASSLPIFVVFGKGSAPTATEVGDGVTPVPPGAAIIIEKGECDYVAYISTGVATGAVYFTAGRGQ